MTTSPIDPLTARVLRVHPEPCEYVQEETAHAILTANPAESLAFLEHHLRQIAGGAFTIELPSKAIFPDGPGKGDFRVMPCVLRRPQGVVKTVKIVGTNLAQVRVPDQITVGKVFCLHPDDNTITHIIEAVLLSSARTGACATLAMTCLAPVRRRVTIVGSGRVGSRTTRRAISRRSVASTS